MSKKKEQKKSKARNRSKSKGNSSWLQGPGVKNALLALIPILLCTFIAFYPALENEFTNWDDDLYVYDNPDIRGLTSENIKKIWSDHLMGNYHPLTMMSLALNYELSGAEPGEELPTRGFYLINLLLHLINTALVFLFVFKLIKGRWIPAAITAFFFGVHPMHVESVAWIAERKDVLYALFYLPAMMVYLRHIKWSESGGSFLRSKFYWFTFLLFILSALSKPAALVLPLSLLLLDYLKARKLNLNLVIEKIPLFALSAFLGLLTIYFQTDADAIKDDPFDFGQKLFYGFLGLATYFVKAFVPNNLSAFHSYPPIEAEAISLMLSIMIPGIAFTIFAYFKNWRFVAFGLAFFVANLILVLQFLTFGGAFIAERYTYIPYIGLFLAIGWAIQHLYDSGGTKKTIALSCLGSLVVFASYIGWKTYERVLVWKNSETLWTDVVSKYKNLELGYGMRGNYFRENKIYDKALKDYEVYMRLKPSNPQMYSNRGNVYFDLGKNELAIQDYNKAVELRENYKDVYTNRAAAYSKLGNYEQAMKDFSKTLEIDPNYANAYMNRAIVLDQIGRYREAIKDYDAYLKLKPNHAGVYSNRGTSKQALGQHAEAVKDFSSAISLEPSLGVYYVNRAISYYVLGQTSKAKADAVKGKALGSKLTPRLNALVNS